MAFNPKSLENLKPISDDIRYNPNTAHRIRIGLNRDFVQALVDDFKENGQQAIRDLRTEDLTSYCKIIASLVPREINVKDDRGLAAFNLEDIASLLEGIRSLGALRGGAGEGVTITQEAEQAPLLQAVQEAKRVPRSRKKPS